VSGSSNTWTNTVTLSGDATVNVPGATDTLTLNGVIQETGGSRGLTKVGVGTLTFGGANSNTYTGLTTVNEGTLLLGKDGGATTALAITGGLVVGNGSGPAAVAQELFSNQVADSAPVTVQSDGTFDLNGRFDAVGLVTITDGMVKTGATGTLMGSSLNMTGGL